MNEPRKRFRKVSRRVPTAISFFFVNDVYSKKNKKKKRKGKKTHGKPKLRNN